MPAPATNQDLLDLVKKSELVPAARLEAFSARVAAAASAKSPRELASLLIAAGLLTHFQAEQFLLGVSGGFTIGKYRVLERIGTGGMGTVYLCEHQLVGRKVAIKVLPTSQANNPSALGRFYREARASGVLDHPNLVKAHDVDTDGALHYLVMDYVDGSSLQEIVCRFGPLPVRRACHYIRDAARGLQAAHAAGLIHRDIKPANILLERNGTIRVLDLGLARFFNDNLDMLTLKYDDQNVLGTADYVSPEQALDSHEVDIRTDIYSLGCTFYFCLTGQPPFPTGKIAQKLVWHQVRQPTPVRELRPEIPADVTAILDTMMAKNPASRYQTPGEIIEALTAFTREPIPLPREEEMPKLSPAASATIPGNPGPATMRRASGQQRRVGVNLPPVPPTAAMPVALAQMPGSAQGVVVVSGSAHGSSNKMVLLGQQAPAGDMTTPRSWDAGVPTKQDDVQCTTAYPSYLLDSATQATPTRPAGLSPTATIVFAALAAIGGFLGMALAWRLLGG